MSISVVQSVFRTFVFDNATMCEHTEEGQRRTEAFDDLKPPGQDPRWDIFASFHEYLEKTFPLVYVPVCLS